MESGTSHSAQTTKNTFNILMSEVGRLVWPEKYKNVCKNNRQKLYNDIIELLQEKNLGWTKQNVLSEGRPFVMQLSDIIWQLDGHHEKFAMQTCPVPEFFQCFKNTICLRATNEEDQILNVNLFPPCLSNSSIFYNK